MTSKQLRLLAVLCAAVFLVGCGGSDSSSSGVESQGAEPPSSRQPDTAVEGTEGSERKQGTPPVRHRSEAGKPARSQEGTHENGTEGSPDSTASQPPEDQRSQERRRKEARERKEAENQPPPRPKPGEEPQSEHVPKPKEIDSP